MVVENERVEDVSERLRNAAESENGRDMVDRVCNPAIVSDQNNYGMTGSARKPEEVVQLTESEWWFRLWLVRERIWDGSPP